GGIDGGVDGRGVVSKIVDNQNPCGLTLYLHAALNAMESVECFANCGDGDASALCDNDCREGVQTIVAARSVEAELSKILAVISDAEFHTVAIGDHLVSHPVIRCIEAVAMHRGEGFFG